MATDTVSAGFLEAMKNVAPEAQSHDEDFVLHLSFSAVSTAWIEQLQ